MADTPVAPFQTSTIISPKPVLSSRSSSSWSDQSLPVSSQSAFSPVSKSFEEPLLRIGVPQIVERPSAATPALTPANDGPMNRLNRVELMMMAYPFLNPALTFMPPMNLATFSGFPTPNLVPAPNFLLSERSTEHVSSSFNDFPQEIGRSRNPSTSSKSIPIQKNNDEFKKCRPLALAKHSSRTELRHLLELGEIRKRRLQSFNDGNIKQISECRVCGTCSFAGTSKFLGTFMRQHLYTHVDVPLFTCKKCPDFQSCTKDKATKHASKSHNDDQSLVEDHRAELDETLVHLARKCFGSLIVNK